MGNRGIDGPWKCDFGVSPNSPAKRELGHEKAISRGKISKIAEGWVEEEEREIIRVN